jgi:hypothetical protein
MSILENLHSKNLLANNSIFMVSDIKETLKIFGNNNKLAKKSG